MNKHSRLFSPFPAISTSASYNPINQFININSYTEEDFYKESISKNITTKGIEKISLFAHELTHWLDHLSTLWGQEQIILKCNAFSSRANNNEYHFWRIKDFHNALSHQIFPGYFKTKHEHIEGSIKDRWKYDYSFGQRFNNDGKLETEKPIMFIRFYSSDNKKICRHPISTSSILETNATNIEYNIKLNLSQNLDPVNNKLATKKYSNELSELLYHPDLTEYTAIAHLTSNTTNISEIIETYSTASKIGYLVLNIPFAIYKKVDTKSIRKTINNNDINEKIKYFIKNFDRGFAFYNLINIYNKNKRSTKELLNAANLPDEQVLSDIILYQMEQNLSKLINGPFKQMGAESILTGIEIFKKRGLFGNKTNIFEYIEGKNKMPHIIFGDTYFDTDKLSISDIQAKANSNQELTITEKYHLLDYYQNKCTEFIDACGR